MFAVSAVLHTDEDAFEVRRNSEWFDAMGVAEFLTHVSAVTHAQLISRDMFQTRIARGDAIHMHEMLYPILQGYDSLMLDSDMTIVGTDQLFNELMGRFYQQRADQPPQIVITTKIMPGTDGKEKQSKSLGNYIALADSPRDKFGKTLSIPDTLTEQYFIVYTDVPLPQVEKIMASHPRDAKLALATSIVARYHGMEVAEAEREWFERTFSQRQIPQDIPELEVPAESTLYEIVKLAAPQQSGRQIREYFTDGAIKVDGVKATDFDSRPEWRTATLSIGRRRWFRVTRKDV
jgi:tyrosyl-tRNA synthetase